MTAPCPKERPQRVEGDVNARVEGPYRHGSQWRCRIKSAEGRKWCQAADTPEEATRIAETLLGEKGVPPDSQVPAPQVPAPQVPAPQVPEARQSLGPIRIEGPFAHGSGWRCRVLMPAGPKWCPTRNTRERAWRIAEAVVAEAAQQGQHSVKDAIVAYLDYQRDVKGNRPGTITTSGHVLRRFFAPMLDHELAKLTPQKGADLYERQHRGKGLKTHRPIAADSHRGYLLQARSFMTWCMEQNWIRIHPLAKVKPVGQRSHGKTQLSIDEARKLYRHCMKLAPTDDGALAVLLALAMGLRAGEIVTRTVRDLDDGGRLLRVEPNDSLTFRPKTRASRRPVPIPSDLRPLLAMRTRAKLPSALLFISEKTGGPHWRDWVAEQAHHHCKEAGVRSVCAHALRGVAATSAVEAGIAAEAVAKLLGHESTSMTRQSYIAPGALEQQEREQVQQVLTATSPSPTP